MPKPDDQRAEALKRLDEGLDAFAAGRAQKTDYQESRAAGEGYRLLAELIGGILGGLGLGWGFDQIVHTTPLGMVSGLLIGLGISVFVIVRQAGQMSAKASADAGPAKPAASDGKRD